MFSLNCSKNTPTNSVVQNLAVANWDTSFAVAGCKFGEGSDVSASVLSTGDNARMRGFYDKMLNKSSLKIGFIGGSITAGTGANPIENSYANQLCSFMHKNYPDRYFTAINAGIGATSPRFACSRVKEDLLNNTPDMIIVEFAVNEIYPTDSAAYEGLIRQCLKNTDVPVILFFTTNNTGSNANQLVQSRIGAHYNLPMISYHDLIWPYVSAGEIPWDSLSRMPYTRTITAT